MLVSGAGLGNRFPLVSIHSQWFMLTFDSLNTVSAGGVKHGEGKFNEVAMVW